MADLDSNTLKALKSTIATDAPQLAALLDGPNASVAVSALAKTLLGDVEATLVDVLAAAQKADKLKIVAAEQEAQLRLRQSGGGSLADLATLIQAQTAQQSVANQDTENARRMQIATHDTTNKWLAYIVTGGFFALIVLLVFANPIVSEIDDGVKNLLFTLLGVVATGWATIIGFYFGSSAGSAQKTQAINAALLQRGPSPPPSGSQTPSANPVA